MTTPRPGRCSAKDLAEANFKPFDANDLQDFYDDGQTLLVSCADYSYPTMNRVRLSIILIEYRNSTASFQLATTGNLRKKPVQNAFVPTTRMRVADLLARNQISNAYQKVFARYLTFKAPNSTT